MWLFNEIVKEPRTSVPPNSDIGLTPEKAQKNLIRLVKMAAKELEIEIQRVRVDSGSTGGGGGGTTNSATPPAPASFAEMIGKGFYILNFSVLYGFSFSLLFYMIFNSCLRPNLF